MPTFYSDDEDTAQNTFVVMVWLYLDTKHTWLELIKLDFWLNIQSFVATYDWKMSQRLKTPC